MRLSFLGGIVAAVALSGMGAYVANVKVVDALPKAPKDTTYEHTPRPPTEMRSLTEAIAGRWTTANVYGPASPQGVTYHGEQNWRIGPGGFTLLEEEHGDTPSGEFFLLAVHWWDGSANKFRAILCNNSGPGACSVDSYSNSSITWDGKQLVIDLDFSQAGKKMRWHEVFGDFRPDSFTQTGDLGEIGGTSQRFVTIHATRVAESK